MNLKGRDFMKKKSILPLVTVTMLATALLGGCANKTESATTSEATPTEAVKEGNSYAGQTISGEVTEIDGDTISMTPEGEEDDISFAVNDDVAITREGMEQPPEMSGDDSSNTPSECRMVKLLLITANSLATAVPITIPTATHLRRSRTVKCLPVTAVHPVIAVPTIIPMATRLRRCRMAKPLPEMLREATWQLPPTHP